MATNAPYYHMRGSQFTNPTNASFMPDHAVAAEYDLPASATTNLSLNDAGATAASSTPYVYSERRPSEEADLPIASLEDNHQFAELLEAATTAAAGQAARANTARMEVESTKGKRKRVSSSPAANGSAMNAEQSKRAKKNIQSNIQVHDSENGARERSETGSAPPSSESLLNDARAAGVHSAAALFRRTSEKSSRKYTRPPMSKLFMSLQLTPENFLQLQAQAKTYMLDPAHPERQSCVGNRGKSDTDMVKLRLFNCVRDFLSDGVGEQYYGEGVEKPRQSDTMEAARALGEDKVPSEEKMVWPRDGNKIISRVTPLLRRMVTNERQRMYAVVSRKVGSKKKEATPTPSPGDETHDVGQGVKQGQPLPASPLQASSPQASTPMRTIASPTSSPTDREPAMVTQYAESESTLKLFPGVKLKLPTEHDPELSLSHISIFLSKNGYTLRNEKRFTNIPSAPLINMTWQELSIRIVELVKEALLLYPDLQEELQRSVNMGPDALQGLAAAATEMHRNNMEASTSPESTGAAGSNEGRCSQAANARTTTTTQIQTSHQSHGTTDPSTPSTTVVKRALLPSAMGAAAAARERLPGFKIGARTEAGWTSVSSEEDWSRVKMDAARAVWADKTCNLVVTLLP